MNVLLDETLQPLICDFGLTKVLGGKYEATLTSLQGAGSWNWMSPEVLMGETKTKSSDIYAFGMLIVEVRLDKKNQVDCSDDMSDFLE